ncbi:Tat (Twin-arginine translocation) pathway signal sequence domain protein [hydrothermal vent metagenome]|uniref:Tat (Twin-arginine translocation) pathway signal sequence domain protein n=1 Tax=hydrothermal vent metagenome TaxID=652676 RepID=A0A1W1BYZ7_9ZZZZ
MQRRFFLSMCGVGATTMLMATERVSRDVLPKDISDVIRKVQRHMFPPDSLLPSADSSQITLFLEETLSHQTFDRDIRRFVINGAKELQEREGGRFLTYGDAQIEKALRSYEESSYGSNWLDRIMILSLEGLLSDPIYGGNAKESGWKALSTRGGDPRPTTRYAGL